MATYENDIYIDDIEFTSEYTYTETCEATITIEPSVEEPELGGELLVETHIHNTPSVPTVAIEAVVPDATITMTPVTPVMMDILIVPDATITMTPSMGATVLGSEAIEATIRVTPSVATQALADPALEDLIIATRVREGLLDTMIQGEVDFDEDASSLLGKQTVLKIPDYTGTEQEVLVGFYASMNAESAAVGENASLIVYDYAWFLTMNYLSDRDLVLLSLDEQVAKSQYRLNYDFCTVVGLDFHVGDIVVGGTTHHTGKVIQNEFGYMGLGVGYLILEDLTGTPISGHYFQDDEQLLVDGVQIAYSDGYTMDVTTIWDDYYPDDWVKRVLLEEDGSLRFGVFPYRITPVANWATIQSTIPFEEKTTIMQAFQRLAKLINYIVYVRWLDIGAGFNTPCLYFIPEADIDDPYNGLDLPAKVTIAAPSPCLISPNRYTFKGDERYNRVTVRCQAWQGTGQWFSCTLETDALKYKDELPVHYKEINKDIASQSECDARCLDLFTYYSDYLKSWDVSLLERSDLRKLQQIAFYGYAKIPNGDYRIVDIAYDYDRGGTVNETHLTVVPEAQFHAYLNVTRTFTDSISEIRAVVQEEIEKEGRIEVGTVTGINGAVMTVQTERGVTKVARDPTW
jgi:hypothetical protein